MIMVLAPDRRAQAAHAAAEKRGDGDAEAPIGASPGPTSSPLPPPVDQNGSAPPT